MVNYFNNNIIRMLLGMLNEFCLLGICVVLILETVDPLIWLVVPDHTINFDYYNQWTRLHWWTYNIQSQLDTSCFLDICF